MSGNKNMVKITSLHSVNLNLGTRFGSFENTTMEL